MSGTILSAVDASMATLTFHNPERRNALSLRMWQDAATTLDAFAADDAVRVVVLTGSGTTSFASGADISEFEALRSDAQGTVAYSAAVDRFWGTLADYAKPTIAMIRGYCIGGGVALAASCDLRFCEEGSRFAIPAAKLGLGYRLPGVQRLIGLVGPSFTKEIFFTARQFSAAEAASMGLVNRVVPASELEEKVNEYATTIAGNAPLTVGSIKLLVNEAMKDPEDRDLEMCDRTVRECFASQDYVEGRRAFMEKRKPAFAGR